MCCVCNQVISVYNSSHVSVASLKIDSSPQLIKRGCPSTQVMRWWLSPGIAYRGYGQKRADGELESTFAGHLKPTTAATKTNFPFEKCMKKCQSIKISRKTHLLDCKCATTDQANCNHESVHRMPNHRHNDFDSVHRERISNKLLNILGYLDRYQKHIHILALKLGLL